MIKHELLPQIPTFTYWWQWNSDWDDVAIFDFDNTKNLIQCRRSRCGRVKFRVVPMGFGANRAWASSEN